MRLQDHGTQEVLGAQVWRVHPDVDDTADVLPQGLPLLLLSPDIRALEERDEEVLWQAEQLQRCPLEGIHVASDPF